MIVFLGLYLGPQISFFEKFTGGLKVAGAFFVRWRALFILPVNEDVDVIFRGCFPDIE